MDIDDYPTIFDTEKMLYHPNYSILSIGEFDTYAFTICDFMSVFWKAFDVSINRINKEFRFRIFREKNDYFAINDNLFRNGNYLKIESFFQYFNWFFGLYDMHTTQYIFHMICEYNIIIAREYETWYYKLKRNTTSIGIDVQHLKYLKDAIDSYIESKDKHSSSLSILKMFKNVLNNPIRLLGNTNVQFIQKFLYELYQQNSFKNKRETITRK